MRCDQYMGLNDRAKKIVEGTVVSIQRKIIDTYPDGRVEESTTEVEVSDVTIEDTETFAEGFNKYPLYKYTLVGGTEYFEYVQEEPWSSGPMFFIALKDQNGNPVKDSLWTDEELRSFGV